MNKALSFRWSEFLLVTAGVLLLASLPLVAATGSFSIWVVAKLFYAAGVALFVFNK